MLYPRLVLSAVSAEYSRLVLIKCCGGGWRVFGFAAPFHIIACLRHIKALKGQKCGDKFIPSERVEFEQFTMRPYPIGVTHARLLSQRSVAVLLDLNSQGCRIWLTNSRPWRPPTRPSQKGKVKGSGLIQAHLHFGAAPATGKKTSQQRPSNGTPRARRDGIPWRKVPHVRPGSLRREVSAVRLSIRTPRGKGGGHGC